MGRGAVERPGEPLTGIAVQLGLDDDRQRGSARAAHLECDVGVVPGGNEGRDAAVRHLEAGCARHANTHPSKQRKDDRGFFPQEGHQPVVAQGGHAASSTRAVAQLPYFRSR